MAIRLLTEEGEFMMKNMDRYEELMKMEESVPTPPPPPIPFNLEAIKLDAMRGELEKMISNSKLVVRDCEKILKECKTKEEYITSDAKIAMTLHKNLIVRLTRILEGKTAFADDKQS